MFFIWALRICIYIFAAGECIANTKLAKITSELANSVCTQYSEFLSTKVIQPPLKKPILAKKSSTVLVWTKCAQAKTGCFPFNFHSHQNGEEPTKVSKRLERHPAPEKGYESVVGIEFHPPMLFHEYFFVGHGIYLDEYTLLTAATTSYYWLNMNFDRYRFTMGGNSRLNSIINKTTTIVCSSVRHYRFNEDSKKYNYGITVFKKFSPVKVPGVKTIPLAKEGQKFTGPCRFASWARVQHTDYFDYYEDNLTEATVEILPDEECRKAGYPDTHVCTRPLICGTQEGGAPLICSDGGVDYLYAIASHYHLDFKKPADFCAGYPLTALFLASKIDLEWIEDTKQKLWKLERCKK